MYYRKNVELVLNMPNNEGNHPGVEQQPLPVDRAPAPTLVHAPPPDQERNLN